MDGSRLGTRAVFCCFPYTLAGNWVRSGLVGVPITHLAFPRNLTVTMMTMIIMMMVVLLITMTMVSQPSVEMVRAIIELVSDAGMAGEGLNWARREGLGSGDGMGKAPADLMLPGRSSWRARSRRIPRAPVIQGGPC